MSTVINESVAPVAPEPTSFAELQQTWTPEQRRTWDETGKEPDATPPSKPDVTAESSTAPVVEPPTEPAGTLPESEPGIQEPPKDKDPKFAPELRKELARQKEARIRAEAQLELLQRQLAESRKSAPATDGETQNLELVDDLPEFPDVETLDVAEFKKQVKEWKKLYADKILGQIEQRFQSRDSQASRSTWNSQIETASEKYADYHEITDQGIYTWPTLVLFSERADGAELAYHLGKDADLSKKLLKLTEIPGNFQSTTEFVAAMEKNPKLSMQYGEKRALARIELERLAESLKAAPKPIIVSRTVPPAEKVNASASVTKDPIAQAWEQYEKTGDHKYLTLANKLEDERDRLAHRS